MPPRKKTNGSTPIGTVKHKDKRVNIPTEELRDFVAEDEAKPCGSTTAVMDGGRFSRLPIPGMRRADSATFLKSQFRG